jgi:signal transduction histidine kinase/CheY-like chemotaxis protein
MVAAGAWREIQWHFPRPIWYKGGLITSPHRTADGKRIPATFKLATMHQVEDVHAAPICLSSLSTVPLMVALALGVRWFLLGGEMPFLLLWPAVMVCAWLGGFGPGLLATCLSAVVTACLFFEPPHWFTLTNPADWMGMALFVLLGSAISLLCELLRRARHKVERYAQDLRRQAHELVEADHRKNEFLAMLAHELRNPLAPIQNAVEVLKRLGHARPELQRATQVIERQARHARKLVEDLLDVSRISRGKISLHKEPLELAEVVTQAVEQGRALIDARKHHLTVNLPDEPIRLEADATRLTQVVVNLLNNAAKYTDEGGHICLTVERNGPEAVLRVHDDGIGITPAMLPHVFDLFAQSDRALRKSQGGLGIGLMLVRSLAELHGGAVQAFSDGPGQGSEFVVRLPVNGRDQDWQAPIKEGERVSQSPCPGRILVVDDNRDSAESLALLLRVSGHEVLTAYDGEEALEAAATFRPEVVLLDIDLPKLDGYEVARRLRQRPGLEGARLIALTGYGLEEDRRRSRAAGFDLHLVKPVAQKMLENVLPAVATANPEVCLRRPNNVRPRGDRLSPQDTS